MKDFLSMTMSELREAFAEKLGYTTASHNKPYLLRSLGVTVEKKAKAPDTATAEKTPEAAEAKAPKEKKVKAAAKPKAKSKKKPSPKKPAAKAKKKPAAKSIAKPDTEADETTAAFVKRLAESGTSHRGICSALEEAGIKTDRGKKKWWPSSVQSILAA